MDKWVKKRKINERVFFFGGGGECSGLVGAGGGVGVPGMREERRSRAGRRRCAATGRPLQYFRYHCIIISTALVQLLNSTRLGFIITPRRFSRAPPPLLPPSFPFPSPSAD
jgi:hypothetical protein